MTPVLRFNDLPDPPVPSILMGPAEVLRLEAIILTPALVMMSLLVWSVFADSPVRSIFLTAANVELLISMPLDSSV